MTFLNRFSRRVHPICTHSLKFTFAVTKAAPRINITVSNIESFLRALEFRVQTWEKLKFTFCIVAGEDTPRNLRPSRVRLDFFGTYCDSFLAQISDEFSAELGDLEITGEPTKETSGALEVSVNGNLVHTKLGGDGYVDSDAKINKIFEAITAAL